TTPATSAKSAQAVAWAKSLLGRQDWNNLCEKFVEEAYGTTGIYPSAIAAANELVTHRGAASLREAPVGALLYFAADATNDFYGHAAIYLGNGKMISARPDGVREERVDSPYNADRFIGWGEARFPAKPRAAAAPSKAAPSVAPAMAGAMTPAAGPAMALASAPTTLSAPTLTSASPVMTADQPKRLPVLTPSPLPKLGSSIPTQKLSAGLQAGTSATVTPAASPLSLGTMADGGAPSGQSSGGSAERGPGNGVSSPAVPAPLPALAPAPATSAADRKPLPPLPVRVSTTA
ncbi:MAG TPA: NlpC/P60 family protein, partial [Chloroflexota bacterium]|nr:NlpC/P60 family protein [Chloroflexota bacterium]